MTLSPEIRRRAFAQAITFDAFVERSSTHTADFRSFYDATRLDASDRALVDAVDRPVDVLAIVEDWCPDVVATLPVVARLAEASELIELRVLVRGPETSDIADAYPHEGRSHVPTYVLFGPHGEELGILVERTPEIYREVLTFFTAFLAEHEIDRADFPAALDADVMARFGRESLDLRASLRDVERATLVRDLTAIAQLDAGTTAQATDVAEPVGRR